MKRPTVGRLVRAAVASVAGAVLLAACSDAEPARVVSTGAASAPGTAAPVIAGDLLPPVSAYVDAVNDKDLDALVEAFAPDAEVVDVGRSFKGRDAIRGWAQREVVGGTLTVSRIAENRSGYQRLLVRFSPGGTAGFAAFYAFTVTGTGITRADLTYAD